MFSCSKNEDILKCDCTQYSQTSEPIVCNGTLCQSDTCQTFFNIWKNLLLSINGMTQVYFNDHFTPCSSTIDKWNDGISFRISYKIKIDWMEIKLGDQFIIWLSPSTSGLYPSISLPRNSLLTKDQINSAIDNMAFSSSLNTISSIDNLEFDSFNEAKKALNIASSTDTLCMYEFYYERPHMVIRPSGIPFLKGYGVLNWNENKCITGKMNLYTGEVTKTFNECYIIN